MTSLKTLGQFLIASELKTGCFILVVGILLIMINCTVHVVRV